VDYIELDGKSQDMTKVNIEALKEIFPDVVEEGKIDFDKLRAILGDEIDDNDERYNFIWHGKNQAIHISQTPSIGTLRPCIDRSVDWDSTKNIYIEGDNLEVLKLLQKSYSNKIGMIYIDPPYNTGNDFVYSDNYQDNIQNYFEMTGQTDSEGNKISSNVESDGRYHTNWLNMIYPRLRLARNLLRKDGFIFISIDDNELPNLRKIMDEIFGETNFIAQIMPISNPGGRDYNQVAITHEYLLIYSKSSESNLNELISNKKFEMFDSLGGYETRELRNRNPKFMRTNRPNLFYPFYINPSIMDNYGYCAVSLTKMDGYCIEAVPLNSQGQESVWRWGKSKASENILEGDIDRSQIVAKKKSTGGWNIYEKNRRSTTKIKSIWDETEMRTEEGTRLLRSLMGKTIFDHPKSLDLIKRICYIGTQPDSIILDFFAGSSTTAHAVLDLNREDGGKRQFILVQLPEKCNEQSEAYKEGYNTICDIGIDRIKKSISSISSKYGSAALKQMTLDSGIVINQDVGFRVFRLDSSNIKKWSGKFEDLQKSLDSFGDNFITDNDRTNIDILYELILKLGLPLTTSVTEYQVTDTSCIYSISFGALMVYLDETSSIDIAEKMIKLHNELESDIWKVVFKDNAFLSDSIKANIKETLKAAGLDEDDFFTI